MNRFPKDCKATPCPYLFEEFDPRAKQMQYFCSMLGKYCYESEKEFSWEQCPDHPYS
jgi:hypothetical protein